MTKTDRILQALADLPEGDSLLGRAFAACAAADCFEDGVSADLSDAGIKTLADAWMEGRQGFIREVRDTAKEMRAAAPEAEE